MQEIGGIFETGLLLNPTNYQSYYHHWVNVDHM